MTIIMKTMTSPRLRKTKLIDLFVLSTASVPSMTAIVIMNKATGNRTNVIAHKAAIMAATISVPSFPVTKFRLFPKSTVLALIESLAMSITMQLAMNPNRAARK